MPANHGEGSASLFHPGVPFSVTLVAATTEEPSTAMVMRVFPDVADPIVTVAEHHGHDDHDRRGSG